MRNNKKYFFASFQSSWQTKGFTIFDGKKNPSEKNKITSKKNKITWNRKYKKITLETNEIRSKKVDLNSNSFDWVTASGGELLEIRLLDNHLLDTFGRKSNARHKIYQLLESSKCLLNWIRADDKNIVNCSNPVLNCCQPLFLIN